MKLKQLALAAILPSLSFNCVADVILTLPDNVRLLAINEVEANKGWDSIFKGTDESITLKDGENQLVYQIDHYFYKGDTQSERYRSGPMILTFTAENTNLQLALPTFSDIEQARAFANLPTPKFTDKTGKPYPFKHDKLSIKGLAISHDYADYVKSYNAQGGTAAWTNSSAIAIVSPISKASTPEIIPTTTVQSTEPNKIQTKQSQSAVAAEKLKYWFNQADDKTRKEFINWAINNL
ncbi:hypothetical protein C942_01718 [Photobacterium marinum]|uniref:UPF0319 protein C942_01718 n=2 Tax=Photobacterium marinum TaxID=1056511 RepID=L8J8L0_9GAMM|nr:hypothetical protein C942_01718 [Photobacterium marinum]